MGPKGYVVVLLVFVMGSNATLAVPALVTLLSSLAPLHFFSSSAKALLDDGQAHAADRLLRQALQQGYTPLGPATYANACFTQHRNMLKGWGAEVRWCFLGRPSLTGAASSTAALLVYTCFCFFSLGIHRY